MKRTILIDGDVIAYRTAAALETPINWGDGLWTLHVDENDCRMQIDRTISEYVEGLNADGVVIALSPPKNFRYRIYPNYKSNRKGKRRPMVLPVLRDYLQENYNCFLRPDIEGDDVLGILATSPVIVKGEKVVVSIDKDMKTIPCLWCDMRTTEIKEVTEDEADYWHMIQTLTGDAADGYPGCPGIGEKTAAKILDELYGDLPAMWEAVLEAYAKKKLSADVALVQAQIARICRRDDYDFKKKEVILWTPPTK